LTPHQTIAVLVRLFAIWLAIYFGRMLPAFYKQMVNTDDSNATIIAVVIGVFTVVALLILWFFPRTIAGALLDSKRPLVVAESASPDIWLAVGCALIGLWLIIPAASSLLYNLSILYLAQRTPGLDVSDLRYYWIYYVIEIAFGVWLLLGARGARRLFWWARRAE